MSPDFEPIVLAERAVLAALLEPSHSVFFGDVSQVLGPEHFSDRITREIFLALLSLHSRGIPPDATLLLCELKQSGKISVRGPNVETVRGLFQTGIVPAHLEFYVNALLEQSHARRKALELVQSSNVGGPE
jgi:replicative DNA helicase